MRPDDPLHHKQIAKGVGPDGVRSDELAWFDQLAAVGEALQGADFIVDPERADQAVILVEDGQPWHGEDS